VADRAVGSWWSACQAGFDPGGWPGHPVGRSAVPVIDRHCVVQSSSTCRPRLLAAEVVFQTVTDLSRRRRALHCRADSIHRLWQYVAIRYSSAIDSFKPTITIRFHRHASASYIVQSNKKRRFRLETSVDRFDRSLRRSSLRLFVPVWVKFNYAIARNLQQPDGLSVIAFNWPDQQFWSKDLLLRTSGGNFVQSLGGRKKILPSPN